MLYDRKLAAAHTVHTVALTPTRATLATSRSSSRHLILRLNGRRTRMLLLHHSLASTGGRSLANGLRLRGLREFPPSVRGVGDGSYRGERLFDGVMLSARDAPAARRCIHMYAYAMSPKREVSKRYYTWIMHLSLSVAWKIWAVGHYVNGWRGSTGTTKSEQDNMDSR